MSSRHLFSPEHAATPDSSGHAARIRGLVTAGLLACGAATLAACGGPSEPAVTYGGLDSCVTDPAVCNADDLCRLAIFEEDNIKRWNDDNLRWQPYVKEAKARGLSCGL